MQEVFNNKAFGSRNRSAGLIFKELTEATLIHSGWRKNTPFFKEPISHLRPSLYNFTKELEGTKVAISWGFGNAIGIASVALSPLFTLGKSDSWHPDLHVIVVGSAQFNKTLGIDNASATSQQYSTVLTTLGKQVPVDTLLVSLDDFTGMRLIERQSPHKGTVVELT